MPKIEKLKLALWLSILCFAGALPSRAQEPAAEPEKDQRTLLVPARTRLSLAAQSGISSRTARPGDVVHFQTTFPVTAGNRVVIPAGSFVEGQIVEVKRAGVLKRASLSMELTRIILPNGYTVTAQSNVSGAPYGSNASVDEEGALKTQADGTSAARKIALGAGAGSLWMTAITLDGSGRAIATGAAVGGAFGFLAAVAERGKDVELPPGAALQIVLQRPLALDASQINFTSAGRANLMQPPPAPDARLRRYPTRNPWP